MPMNLVRSLVALASFSLVACGSSAGQGTAVTQTIGAAGGTLQAGSSVVSIPAGALAAPTTITVREAEPHHAGRTHRVEIEPSGTSLAAPAQVSIRVDDTNAHVKMHDSADDLMDVEVEDRNHSMFKTSMSQLEAVEVEVEHGASCSTACAAGQECEDGACVAHTEDSSARTCTPVCGSGQECDDGACKTHLEVEGGGDTSMPGMVMGTASCTPACATGMECDNGVCKAHTSGKS